MATGEQAYLTALRGGVRGYWSGALDISQAFNVMVSAADRRLTQAYHEGAAECGVAPEELTPEEQLELANAIFSERGHVQGMLDRIITQTDGGLLREAFAAAKLNLWASRYEDLRNRAKVSTCGDQKLEWVVNRAKESCPSCLRLEGKVKRASYWKRVDVHPRDPPNEKLQCGGYDCGCRLPPTEKPISRGPLPRLP